MKTFIIMLGIACMLLTIALAAIRGSSTEENKKEAPTDGEKLDELTQLTDKVITIISYDGKVTKTEMNNLRKVVDQYKDIPLYKQLKEKIDPETVPPLYLLTTAERITILCFPSLGHTCEKECLVQITALFDRLGADVKKVEPNTGPRDVLIGAVVGTIAAILFAIWLFSRVCRLGELKERLDKEKTPP